jgi:hypothetical protein
MIAAIAKRKDDKKKKNRNETPIFFLRRNRVSQQGKKSIDEAGEAGGEKEVRRMTDRIRTCTKHNNVEFAAVRRSVRCLSNGPGEVGP